VIDQYGQGVAVVDADDPSYKLFCIGQRGSGESGHRQENEVCDTLLSLATRRSKHARTVLRHREIRHGAVPTILLD
jgi:hypothetical protein